jgi:predicted phosphodiesterase
MKALPISEIHLERRRLREEPVLNESFDVLVCAGDIWEGQPENAVQSVVALAGRRPSIIVPGNHDPYRSDPEDSRTISDFHRLPHDKA